MIHDERTAWVILVVSIALTALAWYISDRAQARLLRERFVFRTTEVENAIVQRMKDYELILRGGVALFDASNEVTREDWRAYISALRFQDHYPGIQGIGYSVRVPRDDLQAHVAAVRREGFPEYAITPPGARDEFHSIIYLEPFDQRNRRAFGFDMHSEPTRRAAMEQARDTGRASVSGIVTLKQETERDVQKGFLMYLPVFRRGAPRATVADRRDALLGFVYAPFRGQDLMSGIFGGKFAELDYWIFDGPARAADRLLFQNHPRATFRADSELSWTNRIEVIGRTWTVYFSSSSERFAESRAQSLVIAFGGLLIDLLLFAIIGSLARMQQRAMELASDMTSQLRRSLSEKDVLLQEVHHRVKNNLQVITSLINLQLRDPEAVQARAALEECQGRIHAIALIHEKLCQVTEGGGVQFANYVRGLAAAVASAAETTLGRVRIEYALQPVVLDVGQAIPCGLILQELLSNTFKHAFPGQAGGTVAIALEERAGVVTLSVRDDGVGFPGGLVPESAPSLGLRLVRMLAQQLDAKLATENERGSRTTLQFQRRIALAAAGGS